MEILKQKAGTVTAFRRIGVLTLQDLLHAKNGDCPGFLRTAWRETRLQ